MSDVLDAIALATDAQRRATTPDHSAWVVANAGTGKTKVLIGLVNNEFVHLPMKAAVSSRNHVDPEGSLWRDTMEATHQPILMINSDTYSAALGIKKETP